MPRIGNDQVAQNILQKFIDDRGRPMDLKKLPRGLFFEQDVTWHERASCAGMPTEWFFPDNLDDARLAFSICQLCPVKPECGRYRSETNTTDGIWAGEWWGYTRRGQTAVRSRGSRY